MTHTHPNAERIEREFQAWGEAADVCDAAECATCAASIETRCVPCDECGTLDEEA